MTNIITTTEGRKLDDACAKAIQRHMEIVDHLVGSTFLRETYIRDRSHTTRYALFAVRMALLGDYTFLTKLAHEAIPEPEPDIEPDLPEVLGGEKIWPR